MYHFFAPQEQGESGIITLCGADVNHIRVLRMKTGDSIRVSDASDRDFLCEITCIDTDKVVTRVVAGPLEDSELPVGFCLFQGLPKGDKMELIIEKCTELGVKCIIPVEMRRSVMKLDDKKKEARRERWQKIAESAAKQSKRRLIPAVEPVLGFKEAMKRAALTDVLLVPYECADGMDYTRDVLSSLPKGGTAGIWIGPEGGFDEDEIGALSEAGAKIITLGPRILRTETAGPAVLAMCGILLQQ